MKRFFKLMIGVLLLPFCWAFSRAVFEFLQQSPVEEGFGWGEWALPAGFMVAVAGFFILPRALRTYVLAHELTHALWGLLMGAKVGKMRVGKNGGQVMLSKGNFIISLAPYFFPFYTGLVIAVWFFLDCFFELASYEAWWLVAVGLTWGFHVTYTILMLSEHQPDVQENGRLFSYVVIYAANLFFVSLWMVAIGPLTFFEAGQLLVAETGSVYVRVGQFLIKLVERVGFN